MSTTALPMYKSVVDNLHTGKDVEEASLKVYLEWVTSLEAKQLSNNSIHNNQACELTRGDER